MQTLTQIPKLFEKGESLERLAVGDLIQPRGDQERVYQIALLGPNDKRFSITTLSRFRKGENQLSPCISKESYVASIEMLKQGRLVWQGGGGVLKYGRNPEVVSKKENKREMEEYSRYNEFLNVYGDYE